MAVGEGSPAEDLDLPKAAAARSLVQRADVADAELTADFQVGEWRSWVVAAAHLANLLHHHGQGHFCSQNQKIAECTTHRNPSGYQHTHSHHQSLPDGSAAPDVADAEPAQYHVLAVQKRYTNCPALVQLAVLANGSTELQVDGNMTKHPAVGPAVLVELETSAAAVVGTVAGAADPDLALGPGASGVHAEHIVGVSVGSVGVTAAAGLVVRIDVQMEWPMCQLAIAQTALVLAESAQTVK